MSLAQEFTNQNLHGHVEQDQIHSGPADAIGGARTYDDEAALKILSQDVETAEADKVLKDMTQLWTVSDQLLQTPWLSQYFYNPAKANVPRYTLSNVIDVVTTKIHEALFYETPPFMLRPNPKQDQRVMWAKEAVLETQLREMNFDVECDKGWFQCAHLGTQIYKYGWKDDTRKRPVAKRKDNPVKVSTPLGEKTIDTPESDEFEIVMESEDVHRPWLKWRDLRYLLIAPTWNEGDIRKAPWVVDRDYVTFDEIDELRGVAGYQIPSREELETLFFPPEGGQLPAGGDVTEQRPIQMRAWLSHSAGREVNDSADPFARKLEILERWDKNKVTVALRNQHGYLLIRNETHDNGAVPYLSSNWRNLPSNGFGQGLGQLIGPDQQIEKGTLCAYLDVLAFIARPSYVRQKALNTPSQNERLDLGTIISVEGPVNDAFKLIEQPRIDNGLVMAIDAAKTSAASTSGANELVSQGNTVGAGRGTGMRSGTGAAAVTQANASRLDGPVERFIRQVFIPWLYIMDEMNMKRLPTRSLREILAADQEHDYAGIDHIEYRNAKAQYEVLAGSHLGAREKMAQFMPFLEQMVSTPAVMQAAQDADLEFDVEEFFKFFAQLAGFKYAMTFWKKMTPERKAQKMANSPAAIQAAKAKQAKDLLAQKGQQDAQKQDQADLNRAANEVIRTGIEHQMEPGIPGNNEEIVS